MNKETSIPKVLYLNISKEPFEVMVRGEKPEEYRKPSYWIKSRLYNKDGTLKNYDLIKFINGYGNNRPYFICNYEGFEIQTKSYSHYYTNGLVVKVEKGDFMIKLGNIIESSILKNVSTFKHVKEKSN